MRRLRGPFSPRRTLSAALTLGALFAAVGCAPGGDASEAEAPEVRAPEAGAPEGAIPGVQGPRLLPGVHEAGLETAAIPWGLVPVTRAEAADFLDALRAVRCAPTDLAAEAGRAFSGRTTLVTLSNPETFEGVPLRMVLPPCAGDSEGDLPLRIPFLVGEDHSRTWILAPHDALHGGPPGGETIRLAHDHRDEDGVPGEANLYGGLAHRPSVPPPAPAAPGREERILYFPADAPTLADRPARAANAWAMAISGDGTRFFYRLYLNGVLRLEAVFDLTQPTPVPFSHGSAPGIPRS